VAHVRGVVAKSVTIIVCKHQRLGYGLKLSEVISPWTFSFKLYLTELKVFSIVEFKEIKLQIFLNVFFFNENGKKKN
jgi:hypothetical protein